MTIVINDTLGVFGGSHTLMLRMCQWFRSKNIETYILCDSDKNTEIVSKMHEIRVKIFCQSLNDFNKVSIFFKELLNKYSEISVISLDFSKYLDLETIKYIKKLSFNHIIYDIHPATFRKYEGVKFLNFEKHGKNEFSKIVLRMLKNNSIISMEETNNNSVKEYYNFSNSDYTPLISPLPMFIKPLKNFEEIIQKGFESSLIITAARADFPFKGYMIGLLDAFNKLYSERSDIRLLIITAGGDKNVIEEKIRTFSSDVQNAIKLSGWIPYNELYRKLTECKCFVGMGTSILDAALNYKPVLPASFNTMEFYCESLFSQTPLVLAPVNYTEFGFNQLKNVFDLCYDDYRNECIKSFNAVNDNYNADIVMPNFIQLKNIDTNSVLKFSEMTEHLINMKFNQLLHKIDTKNDYSQITQEERK